MDGSLRGTDAQVIYRKGLVLSLICFVHFKFFVQIILGIEFFLFDMILYIMLLACVDYRRVRYSFFILLPVAFVSLINPAARNMFVIFLLTYLVGKLPLRTTISYNLIAQGLIFFFSTICLLLGITESVMFEQTAIDTRIRYDYGMGNPNTFALFIYSALLNLYLYIGIRKRYVMWIILAIALATAKYTGSRTFLVAMIFLLICNMLRGFFATRPRLSRFLLAIMPVVLISAIFYFSLHYQEYPAVNILFTGRLELYNSLITSVPPSQMLFGSPLINEKTIDNSFLHVVYEGGIIPFAVFLFLYYNAAFRSKGSEIAVLIPVFVSVFMVGLTESILTFVLIFGNMIVWIMMYKIYMGEKISDMLNMPSDKE